MNGVQPTVSIVVNTYNRADSLRTTLESFRRLTYEPFEVVVVNGPSTDHSDAVIRSFGDEVKHLTCPEANLCKSRNIAIEGAAGEVLAFIDDDAIPEPHWLEDLIGGFDDPDVAGVGGLVLDHTGFALQSGFGMCDRMGFNQQFTAPTGHLSFPGADPFPHLQGGNAAMRRDVLVELGGFDEEIEYYLDETDLCLRVLDAGYELRQVHRAAVHHKFLASHMRASNRVLIDRYAVVKNKFYFAVQHGKPVYGLSEVLRRCLQWVDEMRTELTHHRSEGRVDDEQMALGLDSMERGTERGILLGLVATPKLMSEDRRVAEPPVFRPFTTLRPAGRRLRLCLVSQVLPDQGPGGIGRYMWDLARGLAAKGHDIRLITTTPDHNRVDLEEGVWVHRIEKASDEPSPDAEVVPAQIWQNSAAVAAEVARISSYDPIDAVYAPIWDVEGFAVQRASSAPLVTSLHTTMALALASRSDWSNDADFMASFGEPVVQLERWMLEGSEAIQANSLAIVDAVERSSDVRLDRRALWLAPHGVQDWGPPDPRVGERSATVLFVGRFERRKGIDLLLEAIPMVLDSAPDTRFVLIGRDDFDDGSGSTYRRRFEERHAGAAWRDQVEFRGEVDDEALRLAYRSCDVFVAPSRFESFGLIYVEAMEAGAPVVALAAGAAPEVVGDGEVGLLVEPDDAPALAAAIGRLVADPAASRELGAAARRRFEQRFGVDAMVDALESGFRQIRSWRVGDEGVERSGEQIDVELPDGTVGAHLADAEVRVEGLPPGRTSVVVHTGASERGELRVTSRDQCHAVELPAADGFHHVVVPFDPGGAVTVSGPGTFAAVHVAVANGLSMEEAT
jgi:glycosyltransferase involved in cell wall biosynthesis/GT2 family glycosyltransferase